MDWNLVVIGIAAAVGAYIGGWWKEKGRIDAVSKSLAKVIEQERKKAFAQEVGKQDAVLTNLDKLEAQVRAVTTTQKVIEAKVLKDTWNYQTVWTHQMNAYASVIGGMFEIRDRLLRVQHANMDTDADPKCLPDFEKAWYECTAQMTRLNQLIAAAVLVGDDEIERVLRTVITAVGEAFRADPASVAQGIDRLDTQSLEFLGLAKRHLGLGPRGHPSNDLSNAAERCEG